MENTADAFIVKQFFSSYNFCPGGYLYMPIGFLWMELPFYLLHNRGKFLSTRDLFAFSEVSPASGSVGPLVPAPCRHFANRAVPSGLGLSTPYPLASSPPGKNLQGQIHRQAPCIQLGKMARTTTIPTGVPTPLRPSERSVPCAWTTQTQNARPTSRLGKMTIVSARFSVVFSPRRKDHDPHGVWG